MPMPLGPQIALVHQPASPACANSLVVSAGRPDGLMAMASRPGTGGKIEIEAADDFILTQPTSITGGTFTGLLLGSGVGLGHSKALPSSSTACFPKIRRSHPAATFRRA